MIKRYLRLVHYNAWANGRVLEQLPALSETYQIRPLLLLSHVLRAERVWLGRMGGTPEAGIRLWETDTLDGCRERLGANTADFSRLLLTVDKDALEHAVSYQNSSGTPYRTPLREMLEHTVYSDTAITARTTGARSRCLSGRPDRYPCRSTTSPSPAKRR